MTSAAAGDLPSSSSSSTAPPPSSAPVLPAHHRPRVDSSTASSSHAHDTASSTQSHASTTSGRLPSATTLGGSNPATPRSALSSSTPAPASPMYQPLSLADAIARSQGDITRALDEVLAERNKHCLEAAKLSNENIRIWNLMGKIRKENESLKAKLMGGGTPSSSSSVDGGTTPQRSVTSPLAPATSSANAQLISSASSRNRQTSADAGVMAASSSPAAGLASPRRRDPPAPLLPSSQSHSPYAQTSSSSSAGGLPSSVSVPNDLSSDSSVLDLTETAPLPPSETPLSPGARSVMAQRAKALQQQQQAASARPGAFNAGAVMARSLSSGIAPGSQQGGDGRQRAASEDYTAVDSSTIGGAGSDEDGPSYQGASSSSATPTKSALGLVNHQPRGSVGSVGTGDSDDFGSPQRPVRRKVFADGPMAGAAAAGAGSAGSSTLRPRPSRLEPRDATTAPRSNNIDGGMSLSQALVQLANSTPPGGSPNLSHPQPRLDNRLLKQASIRVSGSNLRHDDRRREITTFFLSIDLVQPVPLEAPTNWRIEKSINDVLGLDAKLRHRGGKAVAKKIGTVPLPEKGLFKDHAPSKVDMRKAMLEAWLRNLLAVQLPDKDDVCTFLCTDVVSERPRARKQGKDGWLTKKGQNLGRWVTRYYALDGPRLDYFETKDGALLGSIQIRGAQIGRQQRAAQSDMDENSYRHAFLILEKKRDAPGANGTGSGQQQQGERIDAGGQPVSGQLVRHVLCAESDEQRDEWVDALVRTIAEIERVENGGAGSGGGAGSSAGASREAGGASNIGTGSSTSSVPGSGSTRQASASGAAAAAPSGGAAPSLPPMTKADNAPHSGMSTSASTSQVATLAPPVTQKVKRSNSLSRRLNRSREGPAPASSAAEEGVMSPSPPAAAVTGGADGDPAGLTSPSLKGVRPAISGPMNGTPIPTGYKFGARDEDASGRSGGSAAGQPGQVGASHQQQSAQQAAQQPDRRRFWHRFGGGGVGSSASSSDVSALSKGSTASSSQSHGNHTGTSGGPVFGVPLTEAIAVSSVGSGLTLPSVVFRCIEYLEKRNAIQEEGIYRMSGSTADVKALRERFNTEGDVDLLASSSRKGNEGNGSSPRQPDNQQHEHDPHAVAGLLKTFLRELPTSVLTRELHLDFMRVNDVQDWKDRIRQLGHLVSCLPLANYSLLRTLCAHLIKVISYQEVNKMTMRNVGIVFSPTLGIPAGVFALFLTSFDYCFYTDAETGEPRPRDPDEERDGDGTMQQQQQEAAAAARPPTSSSASAAGHEQTQGHDDASPSAATGASQSSSNSSSYGSGFPPGTVPPHPYRASSMGYRSTPNAAQAAAIAADRAAQAQGQGGGAAQRWQRSKRNSLNYSEEDAKRLLGGVPHGGHRLRRAHPEEEGSYDADEDFMGGPGTGGTLSVNGGSGSVNSSRRPSPAGLQAHGGEGGGAAPASSSTTATAASPGRLTQVGAS